MIGEYSLAASQVGPGRAAAIRADQGVGEGVGDAGGDDDPAAGDADLAGVEEDAAGDAVGGEREVGVGEDELRALAAELEGHRLHAGAGDVGHDRLAGAGRAGEADLGDAGMAGERGPGGRPVAEDDVDDAGRDAGAHRELGGAERGEGGHLGGLQHHGVAGGERRSELPAGHRQREVPGGDRGDDAVGLGHGHPERAGGGGHEVAAFLVGHLGEEADLLGRHRDVAGGKLADGAGRADRLEPGEGRRVGLEQVGPGVHGAGAVARRRAAPAGAAQRPLRGLDGPVDDLRAGNGRVGEGGAVRGAVERHAGGTGDGGAADEVAGVERERVRVER